jgi:hypothetical protein
LAIRPRQKQNISSPLNQAREKLLF